MNPPAALQGAMGRERKPFTYTPGGLDLSEIKSERMAARLMRNAMNQGVPEKPANPLSPTAPTTPIAVPNYNCLPVQVFPAFTLPANPKSLLRTRSNPVQQREPTQPKNQPLYQNSICNAAATQLENTLTDPLVNNNSETGPSLFSTVPSYINTPGKPYGESGSSPVLTPSYETLGYYEPKQNSSLNRPTSLYNTLPSYINTPSAYDTTHLPLLSPSYESQYGKPDNVTPNRPDQRPTSLYSNMPSYINPPETSYDDIRSAALPATVNNDGQIRPKSLYSTLPSYINGPVTKNEDIENTSLLTPTYKSIDLTSIPNDYKISGKSLEDTAAQNYADISSTVNSCEPVSNQSSTNAYITSENLSVGAETNDSEVIEINDMAGPQVKVDLNELAKKIAHILPAKIDDNVQITLDNTEEISQDKLQEDNYSASNKVSKNEADVKDLFKSSGFEDCTAVGALSPVPTSNETQPLDDDEESLDVESSTKVVKKVNKEKKTEETKTQTVNGDGGAEAALTIKLPAKKSAGKTETKVEVTTKTLPDGSVEETTKTITTITIDGRTETRTKTEIKTFPKEVSHEEEVEEEGEEEQETGEVVVEEVKENEKEIEEEKTVEVKEAPKQNGDIVKKEERSETTTTTTRKVVVQSSINAEEEEEEEEEEVEQPEPVKQVKLQPPSHKPPPKPEEPKDEEPEEEEEETEEEVVEEKKQVETDVKKIEPKQEVEEVEDESEEEEEVLTKKVEISEEAVNLEKEAEEVKKTEPAKTEEDEESEYTEEEISDTEEAPKTAAAPEPKEPPKDDPPNEEPKPEPVLKPEQSAEAQKIPTRDVPIHLDKVEDVEIKPIGPISESISKSHSEQTEIITNKESQGGPIQTELHRVENTIVTNRTTKTLDQSYEQLTQHGLPTVKTYFAPNRERVSTSPQASRPYQSSYVPPPSQAPTGERRHSLLLERLSTERQTPAPVQYQNQYQSYNNQSYEQQRDWSQEPQSEVVISSNVKPSKITNQQWYQQQQERVRENALYNNVTPTTPSAASQWNQPSPQPQYQPQYQQPQPPAQQQQPQQQYLNQTQAQTSYNDNYSQNYSNVSQQNDYSYQPSQPIQPTWGSNANNLPAATPNHYSYLNKVSTDNYQKSSQQYSSSYVPPPWEQDGSYVRPENTTTTYYQPAPSNNDYKPASTPAWQPAPAPAKTPRPTSYVPPAPNQSFVKHVNPGDLQQKQPGRKTYYSEYERRYISVPESTYIPSETKYQPQPDPSPQCYYDNDEAAEKSEHTWRKELREFTEKSTSSQYQTQQTAANPPWETDAQYSKNPAAPYTPQPSWSQTLRPRSGCERTFESDYVSQDYSKTNSQTLGRNRPMSFVQTSNTPLPKQSRGVSVDRYNPVSYHSPSEHPAVPVQTLTPATAPHNKKNYHNPHVPAYHNRASAEPRELGSYQPRQYHVDPRDPPVQSRSFKYLQWITGTEN